MKKIAISIKYKGEEYVSDYNEYDNLQEKQLIEFVETVASGNATRFSFKQGNIEIYFPQKVLQKSIIKLIYKP